MERLQDFEGGGNFLLDFGGEHTCHSRLDFLDGVVDDGVDADVHLLAVRHLARGGCRTDVETHDDGVGSGCEQHIAVGDGTDGTVNDIDLDILGGEFDERVAEGFHGTIHVALDDDVEFLEVADSETASDFIESDVLLGADGLLALQLLALVGNLACLLFGGQDVELVARLRRAVETEDKARFTRECLGDFLSALVEHRLDFAVVGAREDDVAHVERAVADEDSSHIAAPFVE